MLTWLNQVHTYSNKDIQIKLNTNFLMQIDIA